MKIINNSPIGVFTKSWFQNSTTRTTFSKLKASIISILLGCLLGLIVMYALNADGIAAFTGIFKSAFNSVLFSRTLTYAAILTMAAAANAIAFKTGLFNIGVSGQIYFSGGLATVLALTSLKTTGIGGVVVLMLLAMVFSAAAASLAGFLKAKFNVHEVVTTIMLNWGLFYLVNWVITTIPGVRNQYGTTVTIDRDMNLLTNSNIGIIMLVVTIAISGLLAFLFWKTTFGFKLKAAGLNPDAIEYAGINKRRQVIFAMAVSGIVAGIAGWILNFAHTTSVDTKSNSLPTYGFDGIAIALVSFNNFFGIIPISIFFAALENGAPILNNYNLAKEVSTLITGLIMYMSAVSVIFIRFRLILYFYVLIKFLRKKEYQQILLAYKNSISKAKEHEKEFIKIKSIHKQNLISTKTLVRDYFGHLNDKNVRMEFEKECQKMMFLEKNAKFIVARKAHYELLDQLLTKEQLIATNKKSNFLIWTIRNIDYYYKILVRKTEIQLTKQLLKKSILNAEKMNYCLEIDAIRAPRQLARHDFKTNVSICFTQHANQFESAVTRHNQLVQRDDYKELKAAHVKKLREEKGVIAKKLPIDKTSFNKFVKTAIPNFAKRVKLNFILRKNLNQEFASRVTKLLEGGDY